MPDQTQLLDAGQLGVHDMDVEAFRRYGHRTVDWVADYLANIDDYPVLSRLAPNEVKARLPQEPPEDPEPMAHILADLDDVIMPGITHWNHPAFFAYFGITGSGPGILGEFISAALNVNGMLWKTSPAATELEEVALDWLRQMLGLPPAFRGVIMDTASISSLVAIAAARERVPGLRVREEGLSGRPDAPRLRLYTSLRDPLGVSSVTTSSSQSSSTSRVSRRLFRLFWSMPYHPSSKATGCMGSHFSLTMSFSTW